MKHLGLRAWPAALVVATLVIEVAAVALSWGLEPAWDTGLYALHAVTLVAVGALIVSQHPGHRIGWLFIADGIFTAAAADAAQGWGLRAAEHGWPGGPFGEWISLLSWIAAGPSGCCSSCGSPTAISHDGVGGPWRGPASSVPRSRCPAGPWIPISATSS